MFQLEWNTLFIFADIEEPEKHYKRSKILAFVAFVYALCQTINMFFDTETEFVHIDYVMNLSPWIGPVWTYGMFYRNLNGIL